MSNVETILQEQFLNKKIDVKVRVRDDKGKVLPLHQNIFQIASGICTFIGSNKHLNIPLQVNINDHPLIVEHITHISLSTEKKGIKNRK